MKIFSRKFTDLFSPKNLQNLDSNELLAALNDVSVRKTWLFDVYEELKRLNLQIDAKIIAGSEFRLTDLCAKRKAYQEILEGILSAKRQVQNHNPADKSGFDLDAVTA